MLICFCTAKINDASAPEEEEEIAFDDTYDDHGEDADVDAVSTVPLYTSNVKIETGTHYILKNSRPFLAISKV